MISCGGLVQRRANRQLRPAGDRADRPVELCGEAAAERSPVAKFGVGLVVVGILLAIAAVRALVVEPIELGAQ